MNIDEGKEIIVPANSFISSSEAVTRNNLKVVFVDVDKDTYVINTKDSTYSPLALYFLLDNNLIQDKDEINQLFDILINEVVLDKQIKNLVIYKKGLFNSDTANEDELLKILNPLLNSDSLWKSHALFLMGEYFFHKNEKVKSKEFFEKILQLEKSNNQIKLETQKILLRDFSA